MAMQASAPEVIVEQNPKARMRDSLRAFTQRFSVRIDSWVNQVTGFGTNRDKTTFGYVLPSRVLTDDELSALYHSDDMAARMVDVVPQEMLREGFSVEVGDAESEAIISEKMESLDARGKLMEGIRWARAFGGAAVLLGCDDGRDAEKPLVPERAKDLSYLYVIDRRMLWPLSYYNEPGHPKLGQPKTYMVTILGGDTFATSIVHESRLILFRGAPTGARERMQLFGWDLSVMQRAYDILRQFNTGWKAVETLMTDGNQAIFKMTGLADAVGSGGEELLRARLQVMDLYRSVMRALVIDADGKESFERHPANFASIPDTLEKFMLRLAAAVQIPVTILMGQSPAGMNATGESDFRWFYDRIRSEQNSMLAPKIRRIVNVWLATKAGREAVKKTPETLKVKFPALWTETPLVQAQREQAIATRDKTYVDASVLTPDEVALHRFRPEGFSTEIQLSEEGIAARENQLKADLERLSAGTSNAPALLGPDGKPLPVGPDGAPIGGSTGPVEEEVPELKLTPSDLAAIVKVNEARASVKLSPLPAPDGDMTLPQFKAKYASLLAVAANAEAGTVGVPPEAAAKPAGGGFGGGFGGPPKGLPPKKQEADDAEIVEEDDEKLDAREVELTLAAFDARLAAHRLAHARAVKTRLDAGPRPFVLHRDEDETGVSGTGEIAAGCVFADGKVAVRWKTATASTTLFDTVADMLKVHGHNGKTRLVYDDGKP